jgi:RNA recognition motif. (a.k.a. RRM, RBD, or RNP domain)
MSSSSNVKDEKRHNKKHEKKESKRRKRSEDENDAELAVNVAASVEPEEAASTLDETELIDIATDTTKKEKKRKKKRKEKNEAVTAADVGGAVSTADEHGVAYNRQQLRRMRKRVKRGLDPIETPAERHARQVEEAALRREEDVGWADLHDDNNNGDDDIISDREGGGEEGEPFDEETYDQEDDHISNSNVPDDEDKKKAKGVTENGSVPAAATTSPRKPKKKRSKEVPADYVCSACHNSVAPVHWIYDCPQKETVRGTNQISRRQRGLHNPSDCKVFVSGLPFDSTPKSVSEIFETQLLAMAPPDPVTVRHCKVIKFADTGRCKGQAFLTFDTASDAKKALKLNGCMIDNTPAVPDPATIVKNKKKKPTADSEDAVGSSGRSRPQLKLKVSKVLNRFATKHQQLQQK